MSAERSAVEVQRERPRCPFCHDQIEPEGLKQGCPHCMAWHHQACWEEAGRTCASCGLAAPPEPRAAARPAPPRPGVHVSSGPVPLEQQIEDVGELLGKLPREIRTKDWLGVLSTLLVVLIFVPVTVYDVLARLVRAAWRTLRSSPAGDAQAPREAP